jgi:ubiquinone/menaquinone biosynthesis C-methylase UbiE
MDGSRAADYDSIAARYDRRYDIHEYGGVREALLAFLGESRAILEVGCGTGHWLRLLDARSGPSRGGAGPGANASAARLLAGVEPSVEMIARARAAARDARLVRARAEALPWAAATFDRLYCVNALHHFSDRARFFAEARRVLRPGGGLFTVGKDPHAERDTWWVYDYFPETIDIDRERFARVRTLRGEMTLAGFAWSESFEADRIEATMPAREALATGIVDRAYTSQLTVLSDEEFNAGVTRIRSANDAADGSLQLVADFHLFATTGWV